MSISLKDKSIIICSIVRNAERGLKRNIPVIDAFCSKFNDYKIVVYENNSADHTKELLKAWHLNDTERIHTIMEDTDAQATIPSSRAVTGNPFFCYKRIAKMANLRNQYMDYVEKMGWKADYLMVVDLDVAQLYLKPLLSSFELNVSWDAVAAYGYSTSPRLRRRYHDSYALWEMVKRILQRPRLQSKNMQISMPNSVRRANLFLFILLLEELQSISMKR